MQKKGMRLFFLLLLFTAPVLGVGETLLYDFENSVQGWENESTEPTPAIHNTDKARIGQGAVAFTHSFGKQKNTLQVRVKFEEIKKDYSNVAGFGGFSAWVFIPKGNPLWELVMFARSGEDWAWATGKRLMALQPGWHQVSIYKDSIQNPSLIQDIGIQICNYHEELEATILIDQVEIIGQ